MSYDSESDTLLHIGRVKELIHEVGYALEVAAILHDQSKLEPPEKEVFDLYSPQLKECIYGSPEYRKCLKEMGSAVKHHYKNNRHHPEYFNLGIEEMDILDLIEMLADWKAAGERNPNNKGLAFSIEYNQNRFKYNNVTQELLTRTARRLKWI